ncbi:MAG TPA: cation:proton antiporter, partial [bacterium]
MDLFDIIAILISLSAIFSYLNFRYIKLPTTIGLMLFSLILSLLLIVLGQLGFIIEDHARELVGRIDFNKTLMHGMLSFLLFAGALHVNINDLMEKKWEIGIFATLGVVISTFIIGS